MFELTTKQNIVGKPSIDSLANQLSIFSGPYEVYRFDTMDDLREYAYFEGKAYCHGVVDPEQHALDVAVGTNETATPRSYAYLKYADLISVDIDKPTFSEHTLEYVKAQDWAKAAGLIYPSSSYTPSAPRWHLVFRLSERIADRHEYAALAAAFYQLIDLPVDDALASPIQLSFGTAFRDPTIIGKPIELTHVDEEAVLSVEWLRNLPGYVAPQQAVAALSEYEEAQHAGNYHRSEEGSHRVKLHMQQKPEERERIVIDALTALLPAVSEQTTRDTWNQIWMAAHHGAPTQATFEMLWKLSEKMRPNGHAGRAAWAKEWAAHKSREEGYTVASLFWLAERKAGWLKYTPFDVPDTAFTLIDVTRISSWLEEFDEVPARVVLNSQTGSGKSYSVGFLWHKMGQPKSVIFVPTMKLAADMTNTLIKMGLPAELYYDSSNGRIKEGAVLRQATILVTTLQTFVLRVHNRPGMLEEYGLVYVEESDQLLAQFSLAKSFLLPSHINEEQARSGFAILREACELSRSVWFVDGTMTQVTLTAARALCPEDNQPLLIRNRYTKAKADVEFLHTKAQAYNLALVALMKGRKVVVACDTKANATEFYEIAHDYGLHFSNRILLITKDTEKQPAVIEFMQDGNEGAKKYDLVIYNSVMASGVSITSVQPDVLVQIADYLSPRNNLQILNRYRNQKEVYVYYGQTTSLYSKNAETIRRFAQAKVEVEAAMVGLPMQSRSATADLRDFLGSIASADVFAQTRNTRAFYRRLLQDDGRRVLDRTQQVIMEGLAYSIEDVREARKDRKEYIRSNWRNVRPIGPDSPVDPDMSLLDVACGVEHYGISASLNDYIPQGYEPEYIYDTVKHMRPAAMMLSVFAKQPAAFRLTESFMADPDMPDTTFHNNVTRLSLLTLLLDVWGDDLSKVWALADLDEVGAQFLARLDAASHTYDVAVRMSDDTYKQVLQEHQTAGERTLAFSKVLLDTVGLKIKVVGKAQGKSVYGIANLNEALDFLKWRHHWVQENMTPDFAGTAAQITRRQQEEAAKQYGGMNEVDRNLVIARWSGDRTTFHYAVKSVVEDVEWS